jgi:hypothetical protein
MSEIAVYTLQNYTSLDLSTPGGWVEVCQRYRSSNLYLYTSSVPYTIPLEVYPYPW